MCTLMGFTTDRKKARKAELLVLNVFNSIKCDYVFEDVADQEEYYYKGDIITFDNDWDQEICIDVKDDSCIDRTCNFLAEHRVKYPKSGWQTGFMQHAEYDYVAYLSQQRQTIYMLDFAAWQKYYKTNYKKRLMIPHYNDYGYWEQTTDGYLMPIYMAKELGIIVATIKYDNNYNAIEINC